LVLSLVFGDVWQAFYTNCKVSNLHEIFIVNYRFSFDIPIGYQDVQDERENYREVEGNHKIGQLEPWPFGAQQRELNVGHIAMCDCKNLVGLIKTIRWERT
jgi:hypothetical protein